MKLLKDRKNRKFENWNEERSEKIRKTGKFFSDMRTRINEAETGTRQENEEEKISSLQNVNMNKNGKNNWE